jgi:chorismate dehydratase
MAHLKIGRLPWFVTAPFFLDSLNSPEFEFREGTPAELNLMLRTGVIAAAPSSSIEYASHPELYKLHPTFCTASREKVGSVLLFTDTPPEALGNQTLCLTQASATSAALLKILMKDYYKQDVNYSYDPQQKNGGRLLIGNDALLYATHHNTYPYTTDLAQAWRTWQNLPFAFGLWIFRKDALSHEKKSILQFQSSMVRSLNQFYQDPLKSLELWQSKFPANLSQHDLQTYYTKLQFEFGPLEKKSLRVFFDLLWQHHLIEQPIIQIEYADF